MGMLGQDSTAQVSVPTLCHLALPKTAVGLESQIGPAKVLLAKPKRKQEPITSAPVSQTQRHRGMLSLAPR